MSDATARARELRDAGATFRLIADTLIAEGYPTKRGGQWQKETVRQLLLPPKPRRTPDRLPSVAELRPGELPDVLVRARELQADGASLAVIAAALQAEQYPTQHGGRWSGSSVGSLLSRSRPNAAFLVPCSRCGVLTPSKYGMCARPACRSAYARRSRESRKPEDLRKRCVSCGLPTASAFDVCARPSCWNAYARARTAALGGGWCVYAVWFPSSCILKVGFSTRLTDARIGSSARYRAKRYNLDGWDGRCIWKRPGDTRTEAWIQATLAFRWPSPFKAADGRLSEWFFVPGLSEEVITGVLNGIYEMVPADQVEVRYLQVPLFDLKPAS